MVYRSTLFRYMSRDVVFSDHEFFLLRVEAVLNICVRPARIAGDLSVIPPDIVPQFTGPERLKPKTYRKDFSRLLLSSCLGALGSSKADRQRS